MAREELRQQGHSSGPRAFSAHFHPATRTAWFCQHTNSPAPPAAPFLSSHALILVHANVCSDLQQSIRRNGTYYECATSERNLNEEDIASSSVRRNHWHDLDGCLRANGRHEGPHGWRSRDVPHEKHH